MADEDIATKALETWERHILGPLLPKTFRAAYLSIDEGRGSHEVVVVTDDQLVVLRASLGETDRRGRFPLRIDQFATSLRRIKSIHTRWEGEASNTSPEWIPQTFDCGLEIELAAPLGDFPNPFKLPVRDTDYGGNSEMRQQVVLAFGEALTGQS